MNTKNASGIMLIAVLMVGLLLPAAAEDELTVDQIVDRTLQANYYKGADGRAKVNMTITDSQGRERTREFSILRRDDLPEGEEDPDDTFIGDQQFYVYFTRPNDVRRMVFMVHKRVESDDDRWLYLPSLDLVRRIASSEKRTSFVGSHFLYEDVSGRNPKEDKHELLDTTEHYYVLKGIPKYPGSVEFAYYKTWIHRASFIVVKMEYYDEKDQKFREYSALKVETIDGYPTVTKSQMSDSRIGGSTTLEYSEVRFNIGLPSDIFTERYLRRAPMEYLR